MRWCAFGDLHGSRSARSQRAGRTRARRAGDLSTSPHAMPPTAQRETRHSQPTDEENKAQQPPTRPRAMTISYVLFVILQVSELKFKSKADFELRMGTFL